MGDLQQWIHFNLSTIAGWNTSAEWRDFWAVACHSLWTWRNKELHDEGFPRPIYPAQHVLQVVKNYALAFMVNASRHETILIGWKPPDNGWVRLNTDGSCKEGAVAGCGGVLRGSDGEWLGGFPRSLGLCSAYVAELWGVIEGLRYARSLDFRRVELHVDSVAVVKILNSGGYDTSDGRSLVMKIRRMLDMDWEVVVNHIYREANQCANAFANLGGSLDANLVLFNACPPQFSHLLTVDVLWTTIPRLVSL